MRIAQENLTFPAAAPDFDTPAAHRPNGQKPHAALRHSCTIPPVSTFRTRAAAMSEPIDLSQISPP